MSVRVKTEDGDLIVSGKGKDGKDGTSGIPVPQVAEVGQILAVKAVDDAGKPTEWECVEKGGGSGDGYVNTYDNITVSDKNTTKYSSEIIIPSGYKLLFKYNNSSGYVASCKLDHAVYPDSSKMSLLLNYADTAKTVTVIYINSSKEDVLTRVSLSTANSTYAIASTQSIMSFL